MKDFIVSGFLCLLALLLCAVDSVSGQTPEPSDTRVYQIPFGPLHDVPTDLGPIWIGQDRLVTIGRTYPDDWSQLTVIALPSGRVLEKHKLDAEVESDRHATGSKNANRIAFLTDDVIEIRDATKASGTLKQIPISGTDRHTTIALANDGKRLAVGLGNGVSVYDCDSGKRLARHAINGEKPYVFYSDQNQLGFVDSASVALADGADDLPKVILHAPDGFSLRSASVVAGNCIASLKRDQRGNVVRQMASGNFQLPEYKIAKFNRQGKLAWELATPNDSFATFGNKVVFRADDVLYCKEGDAKPQSIGRHEWGTPLRFSPDGKLLVANVGADTGLQIWNVANWSPHSANDLPYGSSGYYVSGIDDDGRVTVVTQNAVCRADLGKPFSRLIELPKSISPFVGKRTMSGDGNLCVVLSKSGQVKVLDLANKKVIEVEQRADAEVHSAWANRDGSRLLVRYKDAKKSGVGESARRGLLQGFLGGGAARTNNNSSEVFDLANGNRIASLDVSDIEISRRPFFPGDWVAYTTSSGLGYWQLGQKSVRRSTNFRGRAEDVAITKDGSLAVADFNNPQVLWYANPNAKAKLLHKANEDSRLRVAVSPDGKVVYCWEGRRAGKAKLHAIAVSGETLWTEEIPGDVQSLTISPAGRYLLVTKYTDWVVIRTSLPRDTK